FPDEKVLEIYSALRPFRSTKEELQEIAYDLEKKGAILNADFVREAITAYEKRRKFRGDK
ncbi:MAG: diol dehydratase small subunit, partial [Anaerovoracaceae bacterium]